MERIINETEYTDVGMKKCIRELKKQYSFLRSFSIGQSCMGREIPALVLGSGEYCLFTAGFGGNERLTSNILLMFAEELCSSLKNNISLAGININKALERKGIIIVPRVNPDGAEIALLGASAAGAYSKEIRRISNNNTENWNANLRGVEIRRNFSADWTALRQTERAAGVFAPRPVGYGGPYAESEPETAALTALCQRLNISHSLSLFCGDSVIYWQYGDKLPLCSQKMAMALAQAGNLRCDALGNCSSGGSLKDWFIDTFNRPAFNIHIQPDTVHTCYKSYGEIRKMLAVASIL